MGLILIFFIGRENVLFQLWALVMVIKRQEFFFIFDYLNHAEVVPWHFFLLTFMTSEAAALTAGRRARKVARGKYVFISKSLFLKLIFISTQFRGNHL